MIRCYIKTVVINWQSGRLLYTFQTYRKVTKKNKKKIAASFCRFFVSFMHENASLGNNREASISVICHDKCWPLGMQPLAL